MLEITGKTNIDYIEVNLLEHNIKMLQRIKAACEAKEETDLTGGQRKKQDESGDNSDNGNERKFSGFCATWQHSGACGKQKRKFMGKAKMDSRITINYRISKDNNNDDNNDDHDCDIYQMCV